MSATEAALRIVCLVLGVALLAFGGWLWVKYDDGRPVVLMIVGGVLILVSAP